MATGQFDDKKCAELDERWSEFRNGIIERDHLDDAAQMYKTLMIETFPILYEAWGKDAKTIDKSVAKLTATMSNLFNPLFDEDYNFYGPEDLETCSSFHSIFLNALVYDEDLLFDENENIVVENDDFKYVADPKTFNIEEIDKWID